MKTIFQALKDEVSFPLGDGSLENKLIYRQLNGDEEFTYEIAKSKEFRGAVADCLYALVETPNFSEGDASFTVNDREMILRKANAIYKSIGEDLVGQPMVIIGN